MTIQFLLFTPWVFYDFLRNQRLLSKVLNEKPFKLNLQNFQIKHFIRYPTFSKLNVTFNFQNYLLDGVLFARILPWYKSHIRGPHLPFEHLEEELRGKSGWPPIGDCKNNEIKIGRWHLSISSSTHLKTVKKQKYRDI